MSMRPANTVLLPEEYNGHLVEFDATPLAFDGNLVKLRIARSTYLTQWARVEDLTASRN
jgi:hypothetical protein